MVNVEMDISSMMTLPEEVRSVILNLIPQTETVNLRLVCKTWNQEIQNNYEYDIEKLDENAPNFNSILQLRIKELKIGKLKVTPVFNFDGTSNFKHPNAIRKLIIGVNTKVAQLNLQQLISLFSKNLGALHLNATLKICTYRFPFDLSFNFKHLKRLRIDGTHYGSANRRDNPISLFDVLENSSFPNLKILNVRLQYLGKALEARIVGNLLRLISKQGEYLEELIIDMTSESDLIQLPVPLQEEEWLRIKEIKTLKRVFLGLLPVRLGMTQFWNQVLCNQKKLEELEIWSPNCPISVSLIQQITQTNSATLSKLLILGLHLSPTDSPFDLAIFQNSPALKTLKLEMFYVESIARANSVVPDVVNFQCLPQNVIRLALLGLKVLSEEVLIAFRTNNATTGAKGFNNLRELSLINCGDEGLFGINAVVFYEIMMTPRPSRTHVHFNRGVHKGGAAMKTVFRQLHISEDTDRFLFQRDSGELGWKKY